MKRGIKLRGLVGVLVAAALSAAVLGSAGPGVAATSMSVVLSPLIGTSSNDVQQVTYGSKIGYHVDVTNNGPSTVNQVVIVVDSDTGTFSDASRSECAKNPNDATQMVCKLQQMAATGPTSTFSVDLRFDAPSTGTAVVTSSSVTIAAQTVGATGNQGTHTTQGNSVTTQLVSSAGNSLVKTYVTPTESVATGETLPQHSFFKLPDSLLTNVYGVEVSVQETTGPPICDHCPGLLTMLSIPSSLTGSNPFSPTNPFSFIVTLLPSAMPSDYHPTGLYHNGVLVPMCVTSPLGPSTTMCLTNFQASTTAGVVATGIADQNGNLGFG